MLRDLVTTTQQNLFKTLLLVAVMVMLVIPASAKGIDVSGTWRVCDLKADKSMGKLVLQQNGDELTGTHYFPNGSAKVEGTIKGKRIELEYIYNDVDMLSQMVPAKVASQIAGITSLAVVTVGDGKEMEGTFAHWNVWWTAYDRKVTRIAVGGSVEARLNNPPWPIKLVRE